tara:strand:- start:5021 stop:5404 length:384 start_codon:yes stop_codon:yes gene_type:complete
LVKRCRRSILKTETMIRGTLTEDPGVLEPGDEIITNQGSEMRCYVIEETPRVSKLKTWHNGRTRYIAVKCRAAITMKTTSGINQWNKQPWTNTYKTYEFRIPNENDPIVKVDLNWKQIYIINKFKNG